MAKTHFHEHAVRPDLRWLWWNPEGMAPVPPDLSFNTAVRFLTDINWQAYGGEGTMNALPAIHAPRTNVAALAATGT